MAIIKRVVGQITLTRVVDVASTTYFYLLMPSIAAAPNKPEVSPPPVYTADGYDGWSETEPGYTSGDTRSLYITIRTTYSDGSFDYTTPSLSSSYEAAKEAYNRAQSAMSLAGDTNQYFWDIPTAYSTNVPAGAYITEVQQSLFKPNPSGGNIVVQSTGITIRNGITQLTSLTGNALNFYNPQASQNENALQLSIGANGILQSGNYNYRTDLTEKRFSVSGTKIDLTKGDIITPNFRLASGEVDNINAGAYIRGTIEALSGYIQQVYIGTNSTNRWEIGNFSNFDQTPSAALISNGTAFIQLGRQDTWRLSTDRIHTAWIASGSSALTFPEYDNKYWDWGIHSPHKTDDIWKDKFLYIRNASKNTSASALAQDLDDNMGLWDYQFWIDRNGNVYAPNLYKRQNNSWVAVDAGGAVDSAAKLSSYGGSSMQPVYFPSTGSNAGTPVGITDGNGNNITIAQSVPSDSIWIKSITTTGNGNAVTSVNFNASTGVITATKGATYLTSYTETDPTVPTWAKASTKPSYSYDEITGTIPQSALPSYVDDVLEYNGLSNFPATGESGKIYVDISTNKTYRWGSTTYVEISSSLALGETSSTAYYGDRGKIAYDHANAKGSAFTSGLYKITTNSEGHVTAATAAGKSDIGLGNVDNKSSATIRSEITSTNITSALGFTPYDANNPNGYITSADVSDTHVNVSTRGSTKAYLLATTSSPTSTKTAREAVAETGVYLETSNSATRLIAPTFVGALTGTASGNLTSNSSLAWSKVTGADDLKAIENLSGTTGLLRKTAANTWELDTTNYLSSFTEGDPVFSASAASSITNNDITNWNNKTSNTGTVTSVRVQASSPVKSSVSTAQSSSLNTTISLEDAYGDLKNPYGSKTARYVLAAPASAAGAPSFRALTNADVGLSNVTNYSQITKIGESGDGKLRVWTGDPDGTGYTDVTVHITAYNQSTVAKAAALDLSADVGSTKKPVYFKADGKPYAINYTIETSVPSGALFTDTTYTFASGTNGFTVTPTGGTAQTVAVTPSITNNVTGSGTSGNLVKWNGTNTITNGPAFTTGGTGYLKQDGTWGIPGGTYSLPFAKYDVLGGVKPWYSTTGASTLASGSAGAHSDTPSINARSSTTGKYYAVEIDKNGRLFVNVPWTNTNGSYLTSAVTTLTTQAGGHTTVTSVSGDVTIKIPTATSHLTNDSGYITSYTDEKMKWTASTSSNTYYPLQSTSTATTSTANTLDGVNFYQYYNTSGGYRRLTLGNSTLYTNTGGAYGTIRLYGPAATYYGDLIPGTIGTASNDGHLTANRTWTFPNKTGIIALTSDIPTVSYPVVSVNNKTGAVTLNASDVGALASNTTYVSTITTSAGAHTTVSNKAGAVSLNIPTTAAHVGAAASDHTHGNITNGGDITATAPTIASGDQIIINDNSASKITNGPTFDGSTTTKALTPKGTWETFATNDTNTTYTLSGALSSHKFTSTLTAGGSGSGTSTSDLTFVAGTGITITDDTSNRKMTIACSVTNTDEKVIQTNNTGNNNYRLLFSTNATDSTETTGVYKHTDLTYNPNKGELRANKAVITELIATNATINQQLTAQNATIIGLLDVKGQLHTESWTNANIATIDGSFYITPTIGVTTGTFKYVPTANNNQGQITLTGTNNYYFMADSVTWVTGSLVMITGRVDGTNAKIPLGTIRGVLSSITYDSNNRGTSIIINGPFSDSNGNSCATLTEIGTSATNAINGENLKVSIYQTKNSNNYNPIGIYMTSGGFNDQNKSFIDIYNGGFATTTAPANSGAFAKPVLRIGNLEGMPVLNNTAASLIPTGYGIYTTNGYFEGIIAATKGYIGGFTIGNTDLYNNKQGLTHANSGIYISTTGIAGGAGDNWWIKSDGSFQFGGTTGIRYANNVLTIPAANVSGTLTAATITADKITSGAINTTVLTASNIVTNTLTGGTEGNSGFVYVSTNDYDSSLSVAGNSTSTWRLILGTTFGVTNTGKLYATGANISGSIEATSFIAKYSGGTIGSQLTTTGLEVFDENGGSVGKFGSSIRLGSLNGINMRFTPGSTAGSTTAGYITIYYENNTAGYIYGRNDNGTRNIKIGANTYSADNDNYSISLGPDGVFLNYSPNYYLSIDNTNGTNLYGGLSIVTGGLQVIGGATELSNALTVNSSITASASIITGAHVRPNNNSTSTNNYCGTSDYRWNNVYTRAIDCSGDIILGGHTSGIGTIVSGTVRENPGLYSGTAKWMASISLPVGVWLVIGVGSFPSNTTGYRALTFNDSSSSAGSWEVIVGASSSGRTMIQDVQIYNVSSAGTRYLWGGQNSGATFSSDDMKVSLTAIRIK